MNHHVPQGQAHLYTKILQTKNRVAVDTETTGLYAYQGDYPFSLQVSDGVDHYFFDNWLEFPEVIKSIDRSDCLWFVHNAKFDLHMITTFMGKEWSPKSRIWDTLVMAKLQFNQHQSYSLDACGKRLGMEKLGNAVDEYITQNDLYETITLPNGVTEKKPLFSKVPTEIMLPYACRDVEITFALGESQEKFFVERKMEATNFDPTLPVSIEMEFTKTLYELEKRGILTNVEYCKHGLKYEQARSEELRHQFKQKYGVDFVDSVEALQLYLTLEGVVLGKTKDGNPSIDDRTLENQEGFLAQMIREHRESMKRANTYFSNLIRFSDSDGVIHPDFRQAGTVTGRLSCSNPNMQNVGKGETCEYPIRKAFIPRKGFKFLEIDYSAQEFRMMLDYTTEFELGKQIAAGSDPHQATADMVGIPRKQAKTLNFALLYGVGAAKLSVMLGCSIDAAKLIKARYFRNLPGIQSFIRSSMNTCRERGWVRNWAGRVYHYPDSNFAYRAPNAIIQGGSADCVKVAMNQLSTLLKMYKTKMILQVHDSILFELHDSEHFLVEKICEIMRKAFPFKHLPMDVSVELSAATWNDLKKYEQTTRGDIQVQGHDSASSFAQQSLV